ncbi:TPA: hypothetical protein HA318_04120, partial [Candidatus Micrarchaeota archaeon]|nr:hypothetical protein [Candidatus Micrarchaeota archaeon]
MTWLKRPPDRYFEDANKALLHLRSTAIAAGREPPFKTGPYLVFQHGLSLERRKAFKALKKFHEGKTPSIEDFESYLS